MVKEPIHQTLPHLHGTTKSLFWILFSDLYKCADFQCLLLIPFSWCCMSSSSLCYHKSCQIKTNDKLTLNWNVWISASRLRICTWYQCESGNHGVQWNLIKVQIILWWFWISCSNSMAPQNNSQIPGRDFDSDIQLSQWCAIWPM